MSHAKPLLRAENAQKCQGERERERKKERERELLRQHTDWRTPRRACPASHEHTTQKGAINVCVCVCVCVCMCVCVCVRKEHTREPSTHKTHASISTQGRRSHRREQQKEKRALTRAPKAWAASLILSRLCTDAATTSAARCPCVCLCVCLCVCVRASTLCTDAATASAARCRCTCACVYAFGTRACTYKLADEGAVRMREQLG